MKSLLSSIWDYFLSSAIWDCVMCQSKLNANMYALILLSSVWYWCDLNSCFKFLLHWFPWDVKLDPGTWSQIKIFLLSYFCWGVLVLFLFLSQSQELKLKQYTLRQIYTTLKYQVNVVENLGYGILKLYEFSRKQTVS